MQKLHVMPDADARFQHIALKILGEERSQRLERPVDHMVWVIVFPARAMAKALPVPLQSQLQLAGKKCTTGQIDPCCSCLMPEFLWAVPASMISESPWLGRVISGDDRVSRGGGVKAAAGRNSWWNFTSGSAAAPWLRWQKRESTASIRGSSETLAQRRFWGRVENLAWRTLQVSMSTARCSCSCIRRRIYEPMPLVTSHLIAGPSSRPNISCSTGNFWAAEVHYKVSESTGSCLNCKKNIQRTKIQLHKCNVKYWLDVSDHGRIGRGVMRKNQEAASFDAHYAQPDVYDNCVSLGQIQLTGETCDYVTIRIK